MSGPLNHGAADIATQCLLDAGVGIEVDGSSDSWQTSVNIVPDSPDDCITLKGNSGREHGRSMLTGVVERSHGVQVTVRSRLSNVGERKAQSIRDFFERGVYGMLVTVPAADGIDAANYKVHCFDTPGEVIPVGLEDGTNRFIHTINSTMVVEMQ